MESIKDILNELRELSPVIAAIERRNVFTVPEGYFENLGADIIAGIESEKGIRFNTVSELQAADLPDGYFENLADSVLTKIKGENAADELRALSPVLYSIQNENVFEVPDGYFERLSQEIQNKVQTQKQKVIVMRKHTTSFFKYAVAAVFIGVMALGVFKFTENKQPDVELPGYVKAGMQIKDVDNELSKITDEEIVKYLEAGGNDVKAAIVANSVDENELPSQEEYLMDEKALDKYLNSINVNDLKN